MLTIHKISMYSAQKFNSAINDIPPRHEGENPCHRLPIRFFRLAENLASRHTRGERNVAFLKPR